jgi:hypothetical protein
MRTLKILILNLSLGLCVQTFALRLLGAEDNSDHSTTKNSGCFPDWKQKSGDFSLSPVIGAQYRTEDYQTYRQKSLETEIGASGLIQGLPIVSGNPGAEHDLSGGVVWGRVDGKRDDRLSGKSTTIDQSYRRFWIGDQVYGYYRFLRFGLGLTFGRKSYDSRHRYQDIDSLGITNDLGVLMRTWSSAHLTTRYLIAKRLRPTKTFLREFDLWIHNRMDFSMFSAFVDAGPGRTWVTEVVISDEELSGVSDYLKVYAGANPFWKFFIHGRAKYIYGSSGEDVGSYASVRLPDEELGLPPTVAMPEDSLTTQMFIGLDRVFLGFGVGWQVIRQTVNLSQKNGRSRSTTADSGLVFSYAARL